MDGQAEKRFAIAIAVSIAAHLMFALGAEVFSSDRPKTTVTDPVVEIARIETAGSNRPLGAGDSTFNSTPQKAQPDLGSTYGLDAGVPMRLNVPKPSSSNPAVTQPQTQTPGVQQPQSNSGPPLNTSPILDPSKSVEPNRDSNVPPAQSAPPPSQATPAATQGNQGKPRSRGPNRAAFPIETVEAEVDSGMMGAGVSNSVDVSVDIGADGSHVERIVRSSGSSEVDNRVMEALRRWKWDPAANDGKAVFSTQNFKFTFRAK